MSTAEKMAEKATDSKGETPSDAPVRSTPVVPVPAQGAVQHVDPWTVDAGTDAQGNALSFDYVAISK
jgi:hypothetical protein